MGNDLTPGHLTIREIIKSGSWYANKKRTTFISEKRISEYEQNLARATPEHVLLCVSECIQVNGAMPTPEELVEMVFYSHKHSDVQQRLLLRIKEARERLQENCG